MSSTSFNTNIKYNAVLGKSFGLFRTNPKITSNVKLVVDSSDNIFLSTIIANENLAKSSLKRFQLNRSGVFAMDVARFYSGIPLTDVYHVYRTASDMTAYSDFMMQYEHQYNYGASSNTNKVFGEQYKFFAPIWIDKVIPSKFIIYRVNKASTGVNGIDPIAQHDKIMSMLRDAEIVKTFDLTSKSNIGTYIKNHAESLSFPKSSLSFDFNAESTCSYNGIDIKYGGFTSKDEYINGEYIKTDDLEIHKNALITGGFERNGIIIANVLNMEFMFDDPDANTYGTYMYFGLYADSIKEGIFDVRSVGDGFIDILSGSTSTVYDLSTTSLSHEDMIPNKKDFELSTLSYLSDKFGTIYHVKNKEHSVRRRLNVNIRDADVFSGFTENKGTLSAISTSDEFRSFLSIAITSIPNNFDRLFVASKYSDYLIDINKYTLVADSSLSRGLSNGIYFSNNGTIDDVAHALSSAIQYITNDEQYLVHTNDNVITIESFVFGPSDAILFGIHTNNTVNFIDVLISEQYSLSSIANWSIYTCGGGAHKNQCILIDGSEYNDTLAGSFVKELQSKKYIKIISIFRDFNMKSYRIILETPIKTDIGRIIKTYRGSAVEFGKISAYDIKDFQFDFHATDITGINELSYDLGRYNFNISGSFDIQTYNKSRFGTLIGNIDIDHDGEKINNIYDRYNENELKETAVESRIVPTINTFALTDSSNVRDNAYILNTSESMRSCNMSPDLFEKNRGYNYLNLEYFIIGQLPKLQQLIRDENVTLVPDVNRAQYNIKDSMIYNRLNGETDMVGGTELEYIDANKLKDISFDYFTYFGTFNGYNQSYMGYFADSSNLDVWRDMSKTSHFDIISQGSVVHRGIRYRFSDKFSGYKFMCVFIYEHSINDNGTQVEIIKNDVFKCITMMITLRTIKNFMPVFGLTRGHMYSINDVSDKTSPSDNTLFENIPYSTTPYPSLTALNIPIKATFNFQGSVWPSILQPNEPFILKASSESITLGDARFKTQFTVGENGKYSDIIFVDSSQSTIYTLPVIDVINDTSLLVSGYPIDSSGNLYLDAPSMSHDDYTYWVSGGGTNAFNELFDSICAGKMKDRLHDMNGISVSSIDINGIETYNTFNVLMEEPTVFVKPSYIKSTVDADKPSIFSTTPGSVGSIITEKNHKYYTTLSRYDGEYNPLTKNVLTFDSVYNRNRIIGYNGDIDDRSRLIFEKFNGLGIAFESYKKCIKDYGIINNFYYHKVNDSSTTSIIKLSESSDKLPLYPMVGEIAIDKKNLSIFDSKYSSSFFTRNFTGIINESVDGTISNIEQKSFMSSTIMKTDDMYNLTQFDSIKEESVFTLDDISINNESVVAIHWVEDEDRIFADVYLSHSLLSKLKNEGIESAFENNISVNNLDDSDLFEYVKSNIVNRFVIDNIKIYVSESKNIDTSFDDNIYNLTGYNVSTSHNIQQFSEGSFGFRLIFVKRVGYGYSIKMNVKIKA